MRIVAHYPSGRSLELDVDSLMFSPISDDQPLRALFASATDGQMWVLDPRSVVKCDGRVLYNGRDWIDHEGFDVHLRSWMAENTWWPKAEPSELIRPDRGFGVLLRGQEKR